MMVGGGVDEDLVPEESRPGDEWPPPISGLELTNKDGPSSRLLFLTVQYVEEEAAAAASASYNTGLEGFTELEQKVVSPLDPNMGCTACYSPVYRPSSPLMPPPVSPGEGFLTPASPSASTSLPESSMIVLSDQCQFTSADSFVVTDANRLYEDQGKLLLLSEAAQPTELVVAGDRACGDQRVELLLSNGTIAYGIVGSPDTSGTRVIQIPREYLVATRPETPPNTNIPETDGTLQTENIEEQRDQDQNVQDDNGHLRALYNTLKEQGLFIEPGELRLDEPSLDQSQPLMDTSLLDLQPDYTPPEPQKRYWCEECNELLDNSCREHQINRKISDKAVPSRARATLPASYLAINQIPGSNREEYGVFARKNIPKRTQFGPMEGVIIKPGEIMMIQEAPHLDLTIETETGELRSLDVSNEHMSNWMRFVRMAAPDQPPNLLLSQLGASLFFTTTQTIHSRQELLVWYSPAYAMRRQLPADPPPPVWTCGTCGEKTGTYEELAKHATCHMKVKREENLTVTTLRRKNQAVVASVKRDITERNVNTQKQKFQCVICNKKFPQSFSLKRHILLLHTRENNYLCEVCNIGFSHSFNKLRHMRRFHPKHKDTKPDNKTVHRYESWTCSHCKLTFSSASMLNLHTLVHAANNIEENMMNLPEDIQQVFHTPQELVSCPQCGQKFSNQHKLATHVAEHGKNRDVSDNKKYHCDVCNRNFASLGRFQIHSEMHVDDQEKPLQCHICLKRILTQSALSVHLKIHDCSVQWECPMCKEHFGNVLELRRHVRIHAVSGYYHCPHCGKAFEEYSAIRKHVRVFHSDRTFSCQHCNMSFHTSDKLRMHLLKHSDHKEFLCSECGKQFKRKDKLVEHMKRLHSGDKPDGQMVPVEPPEKKIPFKVVVNTSDYERYIYKCHTCILGFKRRGMLVNHLANRHPEITPESVPELNLPILKTTRDYYCQYCDKIYKSSSKRKAHILKNHPGLELPMSNRQKGGVPQIPGLPNPTFSQTVGSITTNPHGCQWCHKQYASKAKLLQHQRKKHLGLMPSTDQTPRPLKNLVADENTEKTDAERVESKTRLLHFQDQDVDTSPPSHSGEDVDEGPVPIALSTNLSLPISFNQLQEFEIIAADEDAATTSILIDTSSIVKRSLYKNDISSDLLSQAMSEIGVSLSELRALTSGQYLRLPEPVFAPAPR